MMPIPKNLLDVFWYIIKRRRISFLILALIMVFMGLTSSIDSILLKWLLDSVEQNINLRGDEFINKFIIWAFIYAVWWEIINWSWRLYDYVYMNAMPRSKAEIIYEYNFHVQFHSHNFFQNNLSGFITNRILDASRAFDQIFSDSNEKLFRKLVSLAAAIVTLYYVKPVFATIFVIWVFVFFGISGYFSSHIKLLSTRWARNRSLIAGKIVDSISNISSVRMYNNMSYERSYLKHYLDNMQNSEIDLNWFMLKLRYIQGLSCTLMIFGMIYYLGYLRSLDLITLGDFGLVISLCLSISDDIWDFTQELGDVFEEVGAFIQSLDLLENHQISDKKAAKAIEFSAGEIEFKNVTFKYKRNNNIFENVNIKIKPKEKVGLVGYSGSGKSTFINLITRMFDINDGKILIDGQNIYDLSQYSLRENICLIPQEPILFNRSILENIRYGKLDASLEEIYDAAKKAHIYDEIVNLEDGFESICGEKGSALSGGQRQRIVIARAILKDAPILILDEATSALDSVTEQLIQDSLSNLMDNKTVLVIAHRLSTLKNMDRILVFNKGMIVEDGTHDQLLKNKNLYKELWDSQIGGFIAKAKNHKKIIKN